MVFGVRLDSKTRKMITALKDLHLRYPLARGLNRKLVFYCGPTNSGKTHEALSSATSAETAEVLSPLRLLALEHFETLQESGVVAGLVTGEEKRLPDSCTHISRTVECVDLDRIVDVAVIDEIQMLADKDRGSAWTAAAFGVPARTVIFTGSPNAVPLVKKLAEITGEHLEILKKKKNWSAVRIT